jgi:hypothetical protein
MNPDPDPLLLRKSGSTGIESRTSGSAARKSDHYTTEAVIKLLIFSGIKTIPEWYLLGGYAVWLL